MIPLYVWPIFCSEEGEPMFLSPGTTKIQCWMTQMTQPPEDLAGRGVFSQPPTFLALLMCLEKILHSPQLRAQQPSEGSLGQGTSGGLHVDRDPAHHAGGVSGRPGAGSRETLCHSVVPEFGLGPRPICSSQLCSLGSPCFSYSLALGSRGDC